MTSKGGQAFRDVKPPPFAPWDHAPPPSLKDNQVLVVFPDAKTGVLNGMVVDCREHKTAWNAGFKKDELGEVAWGIDLVILVDVVRHPPPPPPPDGDDRFRFVLSTGCDARAMYDRQW